MKKKTEKNERKEGVVVEEENQDVINSINFLIRGIYTARTTFNFSFDQKNPSVFFKCHPKFHNFCSVNACSENAGEVFLFFGSRDSPLASLLRHTCISYTQKKHLEIIKHQRFFMAFSSSVNVVKKTMQCKWTHIHMRSTRSD